MAARTHPGAQAVEHRAWDVAALRFRRRATDRRGEDILFVAWLAFSRFRIVIPLRDRTAPSVFAALDRCFRILGGAPTYVVTDNEKTVITAHVAGVPVRNQQTLDFARHYEVTVLACQPAEPASKGGVEASVGLAKADLVPRDTKFRTGYASFAELGAACE